MQRNIIGLRSNWGEISGILAELEEMEGQFEEDPEAADYGETIIEKWRRRDHLNIRINVIPGGTPGKCERVLLVAVGAKRSKDEDVEKRILQAIEHIHVKCTDITKFVIFLAAKWESLAWIKHANSFKGVTVVLKNIWASPTLLKT